LLAIAHHRDHDGRGTWITGNECGPAILTGSAQLDIGFATWPLGDAGAGCSAIGIGGA
jgi:hypothetical protein